jgi:hypothetical protein
VPAQLGNVREDSSQKVLGIKWRDDRSSLVAGAPAARVSRRETDGTFSVDLDPTDRLEREG